VVHPVQFGSLAGHDPTGAGHVLQVGVVHPWCTLSTIESTLMLPKVTFVNVIVQLTMVPAAPDPLGMQFFRMSHPV